MLTRYMFRDTNTKFIFIAAFFLGVLMIFSAGKVNAQTCSGSTSVTYTNYTCDTTFGCQGTSNTQSDSCGLYPGATSCGGGVCGACLPVSQTCSFVGGVCNVGSGAGGTPCGGNATWYTSGCSCSSASPTPVPPTPTTPPTGGLGGLFYLFNCWVFTWVNTWWRRFDRLGRSI